MQIHELGTRTPGVYDYAALDTGSQTYKAQVGNLKPEYTSYDSANPTSWVNVDTVGSNTAISSVFEKLSYMFRNIRYLWKLIGSGDFSNVAETISGAIGNTALGTTATTLSGAIAEHEEDISKINGNLTDTFVIKRYTAQKSITPSVVYITASEFGASTPTGYTPIAVADYSQNLGVIHVRAVGATASGGQGMMWFGNPNGQTVTVDATVSILYVKTDLL